MIRILSLVSAFSVTLSSFAYAGEVDVVKASVLKANDGSFNIRVTLLHKDEGWEHYADAW
jgi:hypothetical protein